LTAAGHPSRITSHESRPFSWSVRVYHEDVDGSGLVYHANYLKFLERARTEWLRALGFEQTELAARHDVAFVVRSLSIEYVKPALFNDELNVSVALAELKGGQIRAGRSAFTRGGEELAARRRAVSPASTQRRSGPLEYRAAYRRRWRATPPKSLARILDESRRTHDMSVLA
jgi:acyl-CoA thioester hydrolase